MRSLSLPYQLLVPFLLLQKNASLINADEINHRYAAGDKVNLWVNKVGPYANPQEAYEYYSLPYCAPETDHHPDAENAAFNTLKAHSIGERLGGHALRHSGHDLIFASSTQKIVEECNTSPLTEEQAAAFTKAAEDQWFYQMYIDDLPVWGMVGEMLPDFEDIKNEKPRSDLEHLDEIAGKHPGYDIGEDTPLKPFVYTSRFLLVSYNKDRIVKVDLTSDPTSLTEVKPGVELNFRLSILWESTDEEFHSRFDRYLDHAFFKHQIHWFSIFNSFMMVLFLMGLVALILLRTLRKDYARYALTYSHSHGSDVEEGDEAGEGGVDEHGKPLLDHEGLPGAEGGMPVEDSGWKQVHGDVFRAPRFLTLFAAILGTGWQLITLTLGVILFAVAGPLHGEVHEERGEVVHAIITCYALSSVVAGYSSGSFYKSYHATSLGGGRSKSSGLKSSSATNASAQWQATMALTVMLLPTITVTVLSVLNTVSLYYGTINTIPFLVILKLFAIWVFISVPLTIFGTLLGRHAKLNKKGGGDLFPCRVNAIPRPIPEDVAPYGKPMNLIPFAGLLSFGSIFIELYYLLTSLWNYKFYHVYGFLLGVYLILTIVVSMTTIIVVYFSLNAENYLWQWTAFASGASLAVYVFLYGVFFFFFKTNMNGFLQTSFYFGYMSLIALNLGTLCGTIGHFAASRFVRAIFQNVKVD